MGRFIDLTGQRFGRLTVLSRAENIVSPEGNPSTCWECICDCGKTIIARRGDLRSGKTLSCGCLNREQTRTRQKKFNTFRIEDDLAIVQLFNSTKEMLVDKDIWLEMAQKFCWTENKANGYALTRMNGKIVMFHIFAFPDCPAGLIRDHADGNRLNNTRKNIRFVTPTQNCQNRRKNTSKKSGRNGVHWDKQREKWKVQIRVNKKVIIVGRFSNLQDAIEAREAAEIKYFGEYRRKN